MIRIKDKDRPKDVFIKLINAKKKIEMWGYHSDITWEQEVARFTPEELKEISEYLMVYYNNHKTSREENR